MKRIHRWFLLTICLLFTFFILLFSACGKSDPDIYTVTVLPATGGVVSVDKTEVEEGGSVTISTEAYSQYGLSLLSVNGQNAETVDGIYTVKNVQTDLVISAIFVKQSCSVSFVVDENVEWTEVAPQDFIITLGMPYGDLPTGTALSKTGYEFIGWYTAEEDGELVISQTVVQTLHQTLYARWTPMTGIKVSFDAGIGGSWVESAPENLDLTYGEEYGELPNGDVVFKDNYMLSGWYTAVNGGERVTAATLLTNTESHVLYAHWIPAITGRTASSDFEVRENDDSTLSYITKSASFATFDGVSVSQGSVSANLVYDRSEATRTGLIFKGSFANNVTNLEDSLVEYGAWATGEGAQYYMFYIEMQSGTLLLYKTTGQPGLYIEITPIADAGEAYRTKFNSGATEFALKATYCLNENGGLIIKLYIDNELQLWFEDASPLSGSAVGICSTKSNTEFNGVAFSNAVTEEMGSPIITMQTAFTVSKGSNGTYNSYKAWANARSTAYLDDVLLNRNIGASGTLTTNIIPDNTKSAIVLFANTNASAITGLNGVHFILEPSGGNYLMYIGCIRDGNWINGEMGAGATVIAIPSAEVYGVEITYAVQANGDIQFTYTISIAGDANTYTRTALWPTSWDADAYWSRSNFANTVAIWQEAGSKAVTFADVSYVGSLAITDLNVTLDKSANASGTVEMDVTLGGIDVGIVMFGDITLLSTHKYKGVTCYINTSGAVTLYFVNESNAPAVVVAATSVNVSKVMHVEYGYAIDGNGICTYNVTITQENETPVTINFTASTAPIGDYWNQNNLGDGILVFYPLLVSGQPVIANVAYTQDNSNAN